MRWRLPIVASVGAKKMACRKPRTSTTTEAANQSQAMVRRMGERATMIFILSRKTGRAGFRCMCQRSGFLRYAVRSGRNDTPSVLGGSSRGELFGVDDGFEEENSGGGVDDVEAGQLCDPCADLDGVEFSGEDAGGGLDHHEDGGDGE